MHKIPDSPVQAYGAQAKNGCCAEHDVEKYPNVTQRPAQLPGTCVVEKKPSIFVELPH